MYKYPLSQHGNGLSVCVCGAKGAVDLQGNSGRGWLPGLYSGPRAIAYKSVGFGWQVHLVDQHFSKEFGVLRSSFQVTPISGDSDQKFIFSHVVKNNHVVICTAQILHNALSSSEEEMHVELTGGCLAHGAAAKMGPTSSVKSKLTDAR